MESFSSVFWSFDWFFGAGLVYITEAQPKLGSIHSLTHLYINSRSVLQKQERFHIILAVADSSKGTKAEGSRFILSRLSEHE